MSEHYNPNSRDRRLPPQRLSYPPQSHPPVGNSRFPPPAPSNASSFPRLPPPRNSGSAAQERSSRSHAVPVATSSFQRDERRNPAASVSFAAHDEYHEPQPSHSIAFPAPVSGSRNRARHREQPVDRPTPQAAPPYSPKTRHKFSFNRYQLGFLLTVVLLLLCLCLMEPSLMSFLLPTSHPTVIHHAGRLPEVEAERSLSDIRREGNAKLLAAILEGAKRGAQHPQSRQRQLTAAPVGAEGPVSAADDGGAPPLSPPPEIAALLLPPADLEPLVPAAVMAAPPFPTPPQPPSPLPSPPAPPVVAPAPPSPPAIGGNPVLTQSIFPKAADGLHPLLTKPTSPRFSSFHCIGGSGREDREKERSCRFQNICYHRSSQRWSFHHDPSAAPLVVLLDRGRIVSAFPPHFLDLTSSAGGSDAVWWSLDVVETPLPEGSMFSGREGGGGGVSVLYSPHYANKLSHVLADDLLAVFNLQLSFGVLAADNQLLLQRDCDGLFAVNSSKLAACSDIKAKLMPGISSLPPLALTQADLPAALGLPADSDVVCFENLIAGIGSFGFVQNLGRGPLWWRFRSFVLHNFAMQPNHTPSRHRITVVGRAEAALREGQPALHNQQEVVQHLQRVFPSHNVQAVDWEAVGSWQQQLAFLSDTTVLITPAGPSSLSGVFLPHNAAVIVVDAFDLNSQGRLGQEERVWASLGYLRALWYPYTLDDVVLDVQGKDRRNAADVREWGRVRVNVTRMEQLVRAAVLHVDSFMLMGQQ
jgi:hypothetical protein